MKLLTKAIEKQFEKYPIYSQDGKKLDAKVIVKYFNPCGRGTWLITEGKQLEDGSWSLYGYCSLGYGWEWGYVSLEELKSVRVPPFGLGIERDMYSIKSDTKVKDLI